MKKLSAILFLFFSLVGFGAAQTITIGDQVWMTKNLNLEKFRNGDLIPQAITDEDWVKAAENKEPAWCYYENDSTNGTKYGKLYNWYAVNDPRGLAPVGYHVPTDAEWKQLINYLGGEKVAGGKMKTTSVWEEPNTDASNNSGFSGLPGGFRQDNGGQFGFLGSYGYWWSSTEGGSYTKNAWARSLSYLNGGVGKGSSKGSGFSLRCIKD
jgi:uncharacterized protein (TIGR02145 family)